MIQFSGNGPNPIFDTRASGTQSSFLDNPYFDLGRTAVQASHGLTRAAREGDWSQGEARALARVLPFQNMLPVVMLLNEFVSGMPEHAPKGQ